MGVNGVKAARSGGEVEPVKRSGFAVEVGGRTAFGECENAGCEVKASVSVDLDATRFEFCAACWTTLYSMLFAGRKHRVECCR